MPTPGNALSSHADGVRLKFRGDKSLWRYRTIHLGVQGKCLGSKGKVLRKYRRIRLPLQGNSHQNGRAASPRPPLLDTRRDRRRATSFFMRRFVLVMGLMPFGHGAFSFRHGAFCRHTGRGSVPAARFIVARATRTLLLPSLLSSHADGVRLKFRGDKYGKSGEI